MKQETIVLNHLRAHGSITGQTALAQYGIYRLSSCINRLRNRGEKIRTINHIYTDEDGDRRQYGEYVMDKEEA